MEDTTTTTETAPPTTQAADTSSTVEATSTPAETTAAANDAVYDKAFEEHLSEEKPQKAEPKAEPEAEAKIEATPEDKVEPKADAKGEILTDGDKQTFARAKIKPEQLKGLSREQIDLWSSNLREQQAEQDRLRSELGRLKPKDDKEAAAETKKEAPSQGEFDKEVDETFGKLAEAYDDEVKPMGGLFKKLGGEVSQIRQATQAVPVMQEMLQELMIENAMSGLTKDYPSISNAAERQKVVDRLWTEWNTGAYLGKGKSLSQGFRDAASAAAKVVFNNVTEATAAASLVKTNKDRLASQPKAGSSTTRHKARTVDDIYDTAFEETLGANAR